MTAKEEAKELVEKHGLLCWKESVCDYELAKQHALIAIEFAEKQFDKYCCAEMGLHWTKDDERTDGSYDHFRYLKEELQKL